ncbi:MAG: hypothetical protein WDZ85_00880 [Candidatus Paceibacterota bacterium]
METKTIPQSIRELFWEIKPDSLDKMTHKSLIIERVINYGTLDDWRWLLSCYGVVEIKNFLASSSKVRLSGVRDEARQLATLLIR